MKPELRQEEILNRLRAMQEELRVAELASIFGVGPLAIRRDLNELQKKRLVLRTHGGCIAAQRGQSESEYHRRVALNFELKQAIGKAAAHEVEEGDTILISDGSTTFHLAGNLAKHNSLAVYTNSIAMVNELGRSLGIELHVLGGEYDRRLHFLAGAITERTLEMLNFDTVFLGADAIDHRGRCLVRNAREARVAQVMLDRGRRKILLADHTKVGSRGHAVYAKLTDFDLWITTRGIGSRLLRLFRSRTSIVEVKL